VDNPTTHLELTMIHEAMILEYSGRYLALVEWAAGMKLFLFLTLLSNLFFPGGVALDNTPVALVIALIALAIKLVVFVGAIALLETSVAKLRLFRVPELLAGSFTIALLAVVTAFFLR
jgi:formate hydrogenlyase subunit 4